MSAAAPATDGHKAEVEAAKLEAAQASKARIKEIVTSAEAAGREDLASHFAYDTDMAAADAIAALAKAPKAAAAAPAAPAQSPLAAAMDAAGTPAVVQGNPPASAEVARAKEVASGWDAAIAKHAKRVTR